MITPKFSIKRRKTLKVSFCPSASNKLTIFLSRLALTAPNFVFRAENLQELTILSFLRKNENKLMFWLKIVLLPGKFPGDAHD